MRKVNHVGDFWAKMADAYSPLTESQLADVKVEHGVSGEIRNVSDFPGYAVSSCGRAFSSVPCAWKRGSQVREMKPNKLPYGHLFVRMSRAKKVVCGYIHRLVAMAFLPKPEDGQTVVRHLDGDPSNNHVPNLAWGTQADNMADCVRHGRTNAGERNPHAKLTVAMVKLIRSMHEEGYDIRQICAEFAVDKETIRAVIKRRSWKHV